MLIPDDVYARGYYFQEYLLGNYIIPRHLFSDSITTVLSTFHWTEENGRL